MQFSTRNACYLRASNYRVIPLFLYLDERHVDWMSDRVLQLVTGELQPKIQEMLVTARNTKKHKVYVERGEGYQYCYFLRTTTRTEVVLLKQKEYSLRPPTPPPRPPPLQETTKRRRTGSTATPSRNTRTRSRSRSISVRQDSPTLVPLDERESGRGTSGSRLVVKDEPPPSPRIGAVPQEEGNDDEVNIKDWKPDVDVSYKGFGTSSVQLVLIIEPYPPLPPSEYAPPLSRLSTRSASIASSRSRSRQTTGLDRGAAHGGGGDGRYSSTSLSVALDGGDTTRDQSVSAPNMRNASRSNSAIPQYGRAGTTTIATSSTPLRESSSTPGLPGGRRIRVGGTPLFLPPDTPFGEDDEDEEAHEEYTAALREGRLRLPSVSCPAGMPTPDRQNTGKRRQRMSGAGLGVRRGSDEDEDLDDVPESLEAMSGRLVKSSEIEQGIVRVQGGWEERGEGEGKEEPGD